MGLASIIRAMGAGLLYLALAMLVPCGYALANNEPSTPWVFAAVLTTLCGGGLFLSTNGKRPPSDFRGGILLVVIWWVVAPLFGALPFFLAGTSVGNAYFDAVSSLTTTGAWLSLEIMLTNKTALLWHAIMQWMGGLVSIAFAASVIVRPAFYGTERLLLPFARGEDDSYLRSLRHGLISFLTAYVVLTLVCLLTLYLGGVDYYDAVIMSLSIQASGGLIPHEAGMAGYSPILSSLLIPFVLLSGINFVFISYVLKGMWRNIQDNETEVFVLMVFIVGFVFWVLAGAGDLDLIPDQLFNAASLLSTNGMIIGEAPPVTVAVITALIGGAAISSAGGFKIQRWLVIMRRAREEIRSLVSPNVIIGQSRIANELGVWMHFIVFTLFLGLMILVLTFRGYGFETAATAAAATLSNTGPLLGIIAFGDGNFGTFDGVSQILMVVAMILGRVEAVAALALFNRAFWRS